MDGQMDGLIDEQNDGWMDGWMDGQMDEWLDRWMDEQMNGWMAAPPGDFLIAEKFTPVFAVAF